MVKPKANDYFSYQNLNLLTAVFDEEKKIYLTLVYYMSSFIRRDGNCSHDYSYIMLTPLGDYFVGCTKKAGEYTDIFSPLPTLISNEEILEMMRYYSKTTLERLSLGEEMTKDFDLGGKDFTEWYLENHYFSKMEN